ncbi:hypothetical protein ACIBL6_19885 [Streptomyces sp. NPDC050400]|uniref:hypothetical protein n=1 Tax=Streptomyces sp. NPDC050400 TaxID=3365610 RepID=UPI0037BA6A5D
MRSAVLCACLLCGALLLIDAAAGSLAVWRIALWGGLGALLFVVLAPARVSAGDGWLVSRGLLRERRVRTDRLVSVRWREGVSRCLVLRDDTGVRVEVDPEVLVANPPLWRYVDEGARASVERGLLLCGSTALQQVSRRVESELARTVFKVSGMG